MKATEVKLVYKRKSTGIKISCSKDASNAFRDFWDKGSMDHCESFVVMFLSRSNEVQGILKVSEGGIDSCVVDCRKIFQGALLANSCSIILAHNHPSGNLKPSSRDIQLTKEVRKAGELLRISVLDHIILTSEGYYSLADEGLLDQLVSFLRKKE